MTRRAHNLDTPQPAGFPDGVVGPGPFDLAKPERLEKIVTASQARNAAAMAKLAKRGITPVGRAQ
jgi:hypothetical protein